MEDLFEASQQDQTGAAKPPEENQNQESTLTPVDLNELIGHDEDEEDEMRETETQQILDEPICIGGDRTITDQSKPAKRKFTSEYKLKVINYSERTSNRQAARHFNVQPKQVREWKKRRDELQNTFGGNLEENSADEEEDGNSGGESSNDAGEQNLDDVIKVSPSDVELDETSNLDQDGFFDLSFPIKDEPRSTDDESSSYSSSLTSDNEEEFKSKRRKRQYRPRDDTDYESSGKVKSELETDDWLAETDGEGVRRRPVTRKKKVLVKLPKKKPEKTKRPSKPTKGKRGRPKAPRRLDGTNELTSDEDTAVDQNIPIKTGSGYHVEFKMKVLKYAETHSNTATAEKFGVNAKRIREWKRSKDKIGLEKDGLIKRRPRSAGFTVHEKLQAIQFARERSTDEARLLYGVDRRTIEKWRASQAKLEARLLSGQGDALREGTAGRKPRYTHIEDQLRDWVVALRLKGVTVNCRMILSKAGKLVAEQASANPEHPQQIKAPRTWSWVIGFLKRQNLFGLLGTTLGHEDPRELLTAELKTNVGDDLTALAHKPIEIPENPNKRHRRSISLQDKINIINRIEKGETQGIVAKSLGVATSTVQTIWSCRHDILRRYLNPKVKPKSGAILWKKYSAIANSLMDWYEQCIAKGGNIDGKTLFDKSIQLSETYRLSDEFKLEAKDWFKEFCKRHKLMEKHNELFPSSSNANNASTSSNVPNVNPNPSFTSTNFPSSQGPSDSHDHSVTSADDFHHTESDFNDFLSNLHSHGNFEQKPHHTIVKVSQLHTLNTPQHDPVQSNTPHLSLVTHSSSNILQNQQTPLHNLFSINNAPHHLQASNVIYPPTVTITDALKYLGFVRSWIVANYGPNDVNLNDHLSSIENAIFKKRPN